MQAFSPGACPLLYLPATWWFAWPSKVLLLSLWSPTGLILLPFP